MTNARTDWPFWVGVLFLLLVVYAGAYPLLVRRATWKSATALQMAPVYAEDRVLDGALRRFFAPANWVDRTLFPDRWPGELIARP